MIKSQKTKNKRPSKTDNDRNFYYIKDIEDYDNTIAYVIKLEDYDKNDDFISLVKESFFKLMSHLNYLNKINPKKEKETEETDQTHMS